MECFSFYVHNWVLVATQKSSMLHIWFLMYYSLCFNDPILLPYHQSLIFFHEPCYYCGLPLSFISDLFTYLFIYSIYFKILGSLMQLGCISLSCNFFRDFNPTTQCQASVSMTPSILRFSLLLRQTFTTGFFWPLTVSSLSFSSWQVLSPKGLSHLPNSTGSMRCQLRSLCNIACFCVLKKHFSDFGCPRKNKGFTSTDS